VRTYSRLDPRGTLKEKKTHCEIERTRAAQAWHNTPVDFKSILLSIILLKFGKDEKFVLN
jgi:hypothetical protein